MVMLKKKIIRENQSGINKKFELLERKNVKLIFATVPFRLHSRRKVIRCFKEKEKGEWKEDMLKAKIPVR